MNQAVKFSEDQYGEFAYWGGFESGNVDTMTEWWNKYFAPHVKTLKTETRPGYSMLWVYLVDGTALAIFNYGSGTVNQSVHIYFYPKSSFSFSKQGTMGKDYFTFFINSGTNKTYAVVEPYKYSWDGTETSLKSGPYGCYTSEWPHYCTALIQFHGWKIPDDYPYKF